MTEAVHKIALTMPEIRIWQTTTDLPGTTMQRKQYFATLEDGEMKFDFILVVGPGLALSTEPQVPALAVEPYKPADYDYTQFDEGDEDDYDDDYEDLVDASDDDEESEET